MMNYMDGYLRFPTDLTGGNLYLSFIEGTPAMTHFGQRRPDLRTYIALQADSYCSHSIWKRL